MVRDTDKTATFKLELPETEGSICILITKTRLLPSCVCHRLFIIKDTKIAMDRPNKISPDKYKNFANVWARLENFKVSIFLRICKLGLR